MTPSLCNADTDRHAQPLRKRVLFVAHSPHRGGAEYCLDALLRHGGGAGFERRVLFPWEGPLADSARELGLHVEVRPLNWWMCWQPSAWYWRTLLLTAGPRVASLVRYIRRHRIDLVYTNTAVLFEPALAARLAGVPHVWHIHEVLRRGNIDHTAVPLRVARGLIGRLSHRVIFESNASRAAYEGATPDPRARVVYNPVRLAAEDMGADGGESRRRLGFGPDDRVVGFVGRFSERKDPLLLVKAAARLRERAGWRFVFVGEGPLEGELRACIRDHSLDDQCRVLPFQEDVGWLMRSLDLLVLPSRQESFGLVLVEAAACGKPAIATRTEGPSEIVVDGETGFLFDPGDDEALARRLEDAFDPSSRHARMGEEAARRARSVFSAPRYAQAIEGIIDEVLSDDRGAPSVAPETPRVGRGSAYDQPDCKATPGGPLQLPDEERCGHTSPQMQPKRGL
jgi:glycosyltransferase involved in cell wall biosynthesis